MRLPNHLSSNARSQSNYRLTRRRSLDFESVGGERHFQGDLTSAHIGQIY